MATQHKTQRKRLGTKSASYLLRLTPEDKAELEALADRRGLTLADALREGARQYLAEHEGATA